MSRPPLRVKKFEELSSGKYRGALLDLDNTLYPYEPCHSRALKECHAYYAKRIKKIGFASFSANYDKARKSVKRLNTGTAGSRSRYLYFQAMLEPMGAAHIRHTLALGELYERSFLKAVRLAPGAKRFLTAARQKGLKIVLVSNQEASFQFKKLEKLKISGLFDYLVTSDEAGAEKPDIRIFDLALAKIGLKPDDVVMFGDDPKEDGAAKKAGIRFIHVANQFS